MILVNRAQNRRNQTAYFICDHFNQCDESHTCGGARPHTECSECHTCPKIKEAKCIPITIGAHIQIADDKDTCPECGGWGERQADGFVCSWCHGDGIQDIGNKLHG